MSIDFKYCPNIRNLLREVQDKVTISMDNLHIRSYEDARVLPFLSWKKGVGGACDKQDTFIKESAWNEDFEYKYAYSLENFSYMRGIFLYIGVLYNCWGHALTDNIKKIWAIGEGKYANLTMCYTTIDNEPLSIQAIELFHLAGVNIESAIHIKQPTIVQRLLIPDNSFCFNSPNVRYLETINNIKSRIVSSKKYAKIYLSRTKWQNSSKRDNGEKSLEAIFKSKGYEIVYPEKLSVEEQIKIYSTCSEMVATEGSTALNSIFLQEGAKLVVLKKADYVNKYQNVVNRLFDLNVTYIETHHSSRTDEKEPWHGPFYVFPSKNVRLYLNDKWQLWVYRPYWMRLSWYKYVRPISRVYKHITHILKYEQSSSHIY